MEIIKEHGMILIGMAIFLGLWLAVFRKLDPDDFRRARYRNSRWENTDRCADTKCPRTI